MFAALHLIEDESTRSAALNMAIDEALLESSSAPSLRVYRWDHPALSFGYFGRFNGVAGQPRDLVRRWTGGGVVFHGDDLTYGLIIPANDPCFSESSTAIYERIHRALQHALDALGTTTDLAVPGTVTSSPKLRSPESREACFANPVRADVMFNGRKVAGAAQRRTRTGLLQQGSIQEIELAPAFVAQFANALASNVFARKIDDSVLRRAHELAAQKYASERWLRRR